MYVTAAEAKNQFGSLRAKAKHEPVFVEKAGLLYTVILSAEQYQALQTRRNKASHAERQKLFETEFSDWILALNAYVEAHGIPSSDLRPW